MSWAEEGEALDRMYAVHVAKANPERFERYLQRTYHKLVKEALDRAIEYLRGHASFKRSGHRGYTSEKGADQIDAIAEGLAKQYRVDLYVVVPKDSCGSDQRVA